MRDISGDVGSSGDNGQLVSYIDLEGATIDRRLVQPHLD